MMKNVSFVTAGFLALTLGLSAQETNDSFGSLVINGVDGVAPNSATVTIPGPLTITVSGNPNRPYILGLAPNIALATSVFGNQQLDIGPFASIRVVLDGLQPNAAFFNQFANTGLTGTSTISVPLPPSIPPGNFGALQAVVVDFTLPGFVAFTAATQVNIVAPFDYGTIAYSRGTATTTHQAYTATFSLTPVAETTPSTSFDLEDIALSRFLEFYSNSGATGSVFRRQAPGSNNPYYVGTNASFAYIRTTFGDLYQVQDNTQSPNRFGFMVHPGAGAPPIVFPNTFLANGVSTATPWELRVNVSGNVMAAVFDPASGNDQIYIIRLDGGTFPLSGTEVLNITPAGANQVIAEESMQFINGVLYFVDGAVSGQLYRCVADGTAVATPVTIPNLGTGNAALLTEVDMFVSSTGNELFFQSGASGAEQDLYRISSVSGGSEVVNNVSGFPVATEVEEFGDNWDGTDSSIWVSPSGQRVAFVTVSAGADELYSSPSDGSSAPVHITHAGAFDAAIGQVIDLFHWDDDNLLFWAGTTTALMDLYNYNIPTGTYFNVTGTNGQNGATLPITALPNSAVDPFGQFQLPGRLIFCRSGTASFGSAAGLPVDNLVGVELANLVAYNITGDEFAGPGTVNIEESGTSNFELGFAPNSNIMWFSAQTATTSDDELWSFDPFSGQPATRETFNGTAGGGQYDNLAPNDSGSQIIAGYRANPTGDEEVQIVNLQGAGLAVQLTNDPNTSNDISDGTIRWLATSAPFPGFFYCQGSTSTANPSDAQLKVFDILNNVTTVIDATAQSYWVFGVAFP